MLKRIESFLPNLAVCVWGDANTEEILKDIVICREHNIGAISCTAVSLPVLGNLSDTARVFTFVDNPDNLKAVRVRENVSAQIFVKPDRIDDISDAEGLCLIIALELSLIRHLDWNRIFSSYKRTGAAGFLFIDDNGRYINRFYDFLGLAPTRDIEIQYCAGTNDVDVVENAWRLVKKVRPEFLDKFRLFVTRGFFN